MDTAWVGERLFGRAARLRVGLWVFQRDLSVFYQAEAVAGTGLPQSNVKEELERLVSLQMITLLPRDKGSRRQYYVRWDGPLWAVFAAAEQALRALQTEAPAATPGSSVSEDDSAG